MYIQIIILIRQMHDFKRSQELFSSFLKYLIIIIEQFFKNYNRNINGLLSFACQTISNPRCVCGQLVRFMF